MKGSSFFEFPLSNQDKEDGGDDEDVQQAADHAADDRSCQRLHHLGTGSMTPKDRQKGGDNGGHGILGSFLVLAIIHSHGCTMTSQ